MRVTLKDADNNYPPIIIAEIRKGTDVVIGADVTATVDKPDGTQSQLKLNNYNNVFCNYFTDYCGGGRYNVSVLAQNKGSNCRLISVISGTAGKLWYDSKQEFQKYNLFDSGFSSASIRAPTDRRLF